MKETYLVLDNIRSCENVGSIFRTADGVGVSKIYLCGITPVPQKSNEFRIMNNGSDKISKTALGAEKWVPWEYHAQTYRCLLKLKNQNEKIKIVGLEQGKDSVNIFSKYLNRKLKTMNPLALVVGNEVKGLSPQILKYCDKIIEIPMYGRKESLNVSVSAGIALYFLR